MKKQKGNDYKKMSKTKVLILSLILVVVGIIFALSKILTKNEFTVTFDTNGGSTIESIKVKENNLVSKPTDPTKDGYVFTGWYYNDKLYDFNTKVTSDITLKAQWQSSNNVLSVTLDKTTLELYVGETYQFNATVLPDTALYKSLKWESSAPDVLSVNDKGSILALKAGRATIIVTTKDGGYTAKATVTVKEKTVVKATGVTLNKTTVTLTEGESYKLVATLKPNNATNKEVTWESSDTAVVSVDTNGNILALKAGSAIITVTTKDGGFTAKATITVAENLASYSVIFAPVIQEVTNSVVQYSMTVTKNNNSYTDFKFIIYNGMKITNGHYLSLNKYNKDIVTATIRLNNGTDVTANIIYK